MRYTHTYILRESMMEIAENIILFLNAMSKKLGNAMFNIHFTSLDNEQKPQTNSARKLRVTILLLT